jgi:hypothetical protein
MNCNCKIHKLTDDADDLILLSIIWPKDLISGLGESVHLRVASAGCPGVFNMAWHTWYRYNGWSLCLVALCHAAPVLAQQSATAERAPARSTDIKACLQAVSQSADAQRQVLRKQYLEALRTTRSKLQAGGDLAGILALDAEIARVIGAGWRTNAPTTPSVQALGDFPDKWVKALAGIADQETTARIEVFDQQIQKVDERIRELVRVGNIEQAKTIDEEKKILVAERDAIKQPKPPPMLSPDPGGRSSMPAAVGSAVPAAGVALGPKVEQMEPSGYWMHPWRPALPFYARISHHGMRGTKPLSLPYFNGFDAPYRIHADGLNNEMPETRVLQRDSLLSIQTFGRPQAGQDTYGPCLTLPLEYDGDFRMRVRMRVRAGMAAAGRLGLFAIFENGQTAAVTLLDMSVTSDRHVWCFEIFPNWSGNREVLPHAVTESGDEVLEFCLERQADTLRGWIGGQTPQQQNLRMSPRRALITAGVTLQRSTLPDSEPLAASLDLIEVIPLENPADRPSFVDPGPSPSSPGSPISTPPPAAPPPKTDIPYLLHIDFDGNDLPKYRRVGTGKLIERNGRLMVEDFGTNTRLTPYYGMRLRAPLLHRGDFTLRVRTALAGKEYRRGLIRVTAFFANRSEAFCEVRAEGQFNGTAIAHCTGQPDLTKPIRFREGGYYFYRGSVERAYLNPQALTLVIVRKGTEITLLAGSIELGKGSLSAETTTLIGVAVDLERSRDKNSQPPEMWVDSIELMP